MKLSKNDQSVYSYILEYCQNSGYSPTLNEIKTHLNFKSLTSVQRSIESLVNKKYITRNKFKQRGIEVLNDTTETVNVPIVGLVACGSPMLAQENIEGYIATDRNFIKGNLENYFYLRARGDSMDKAGIENNDLVLIHSQSQAQNGNMIVALLNDSATIKTLHKREGYTQLEPKSYNNIHKSIILREDFLIQGVVVKIIKN